MVWDKNLDFVEVEKMLTKDIKNLVKEKEYYQLKKKPIPKGINIHLGYTSILLTQLANGPRISEVINAVMNFRVDKKREQYTEAKKRRTNKKNKLVIIPTLIKPQNFDGLKEKTLKKIQNGIILFVRSHYGFNTHSLRYAFVSEANKKGASSSIISSMIRHTNVGMIAKYTRDKEADDFLRGMVK